MPFLQAEQYIMISKKVPREALNAASHSYGPTSVQLEHHVVLC